MRPLFLQTGNIALLEAMQEGRLRANASAPTYPLWLSWPADVRIGVPVGRARKNNGRMTVRYNTQEELLLSIVVVPSEAEVERLLRRA